MLVASLPGYGPNQTCNTVISVTDSCGCTYISQLVPCVSPQALPPPPPGTSASPPLPPSTGSCEVSVTFSVVDNGVQNVTVPPLPTSITCAALASYMTARSLRLPGAPALNFTCQSTLKASVTATAQGMNGTTAVCESFPSPTIPKVSARQGISSGMHITSYFSKQDNQFCSTQCPLLLPNSHIHGPHFQEHRP